VTPQLDRRPLLEDASIRGAAFCRALSDTFDAWLTELWEAAEPPAEGAALVAVGGYGRAELSPGSDIDVYLLIRPGLDGVAELADRLWYPIWDQGVKLGHAVRTVKETITLASDDLDTATAVLSTRLVVGDPTLADELATKGLAMWRKRSKRWLESLDQGVKDRHQAAGEVAYLLEPELKDGRGGLRDVHAIRWAEAAEVPLLPGDDAAITAAYETVLSARVELHRRTGRTSDKLLLEEQDAVAHDLGYSDADDLMRALSTAARTIAWVSDDLWARVEGSLEGPFRRRLWKDRDVAPGVVLREGTVALGAGADPAVDPMLVLRVAVAAARHDARIERATLDELTRSAPIPTPWNEEARRLFVELFLAGRPAVGVVETLDQKGLWEPIFPEWGFLRCLPQRNAYHRFTVDRHLSEAAANAAALVDRVDRPDLLVVGTLLHDIGKGRPGDHTDVGIEMIADIAPRMGFGESDTVTLQQMCRHHLLLPDVATRRDLSDEGTLQHVADQVGDLTTLRLLDALTEADSIATGTAAWGSWKQELVGVLVARVAHIISGGEVDEATGDSFPTAAQRDLMAQRRRIIEGTDDQLVVVSPDRPGLFSRVAGVISLNGLTVLEAAGHSDEGMAIEQFRVQNNFGDEVRWDRVIRDLEKVLDGRLALEARLAERRRVYRRPRRLPGLVTHPEVIVDNDLSHTDTVLEVRAPDSMGVLWRITRALHELDLDITSAKVQTISSDAVDSFYVRDQAGLKVTDSEYLDEIRRALMFALEGPDAR
jgi:[protein-PII] uridylyltransferase